MGDGASVSGMSGTQPPWEPHNRPSASPETAGDWIPQAFVSYAWESDQHKIWVRELAERLWRQGVRTILDEWDLAAAADRFLFMERSIRQCDFVIVICTPTFADKANSREGGVGYESMVLTAELFNQIDAGKVIPVLRRGDWNSSVPTYLRSKQGVDLRSDPYSEKEYEKLLRTLHRAPIQPPPLGPKPVFVPQPLAITIARELVQSPVPEEHKTRSHQVKWDTIYPGPCIDVTVTNSRDVLEAGRAIGLEYPKPVKMKALLDTGAAVTVISKTFATYCKLQQTGETDIKTLGGIQRCGEHAGAIRFPGTNLRPIDPIRIVSADFIKEQYYACLIGWDVLRNWKITFDGRSNCVTITDRPV